MNTPAESAAQETALVRPAGPATPPAVIATLLLLIRLAVQTLALRRPMAGHGAT
jgi:hypothetical protein